MSDISGSSADLFSEELKKAAGAENTTHEKLTVRDFSDEESEKENENGKESSKSPKIRHISAVLNETEEELKYRKKYAKNENEVVKNRLVRCTVCSCSLLAAVLQGRKIHHHPVLKVLMCKHCVEFYGDGNFSVDEDGSDKYCRWCGEGGMLYCCSLCCFAFCKSCIKRNLGRSLFVDIEAEDWKCFVCNGKPLWDLRALCAHAESHSEKIKRSKQLENENNQKRMPLKDKPRELHQQRNRSLLDSSSDDGSSDNDQESYKNRHKRSSANAFSSDGRRKGDKKQKLNSRDSVMEVEVPNSSRKSVRVQLSGSAKNERNTKSGRLTDNSTSPTHFKGGSSNEDESTDSSRKLKMQGRTSNIRHTRTVTEGIWSSGGASGTKKEIESKSKQDHSNDISKELPGEVDKESAKLACQLLEKSCRDLVDVGEVLSLRAQRCLEKKVSLKAMTNRRNVDKIINSLQLLMKLAEENLQHIEGFLSLSHTHWVQGVVKRSSSKTVEHVGNKEKLKKIVTKQGQVDGNMSESAASVDDLESHLRSENESDNGKLENKETDERQSDILCADSDGMKEMRLEKSEKRKFRKEWSDSDNSEMVNIGENEANLQKPVMRDKKRRKLEDGLGMELDKVVDPDITNTAAETRTSENCKGDSECVMKVSSNKTVSELRDELGEETVKDNSTGITEYGKDSEVKKVSGRSKSLSGHSDETEEDDVAEKNVEDTSLSHETADKLTVLETDPGDDSTLWSEAGFESLSTVQLVDNEQNSQKCIDSDILIDPENSVVHVDETVQEKTSKKLDDKQDCEMLNAKSEGKGAHLVKNDGDVAAVDEDTKNDDNGDEAVTGEHSKNDDSGDLTAVDEDSKNDDSGDLTAVDEDSKNDDSDLVAVDVDSKNGDIGDQAAVGQDNKSNGIGDVAVMGEGSKTDDSGALTAVGEDSKSDDSGALTAVGEDSKSDDSGALTVVDGGGKSDDSDTLTAAVEGSNSDDSDAVTGVVEGSENDDIDALPAVGEGSKSNNNDALTAVGEGSKGDDSDALPAVGEGSKSDDSDALPAVGEGSKGDDGDALTAVCEGSKSDDSDALPAVGEGSKGDDGDALTAVGEGSKSEDGKNNSESDTETIECLFPDASERNLSDEDDHNEKNEELTSAENLKASKKHQEENKEIDGEVETDDHSLVSLEVPDSVKKDSAGTDHPYITVKDIKELLMEKYITQINENNCEENKMNTFEDLEKDTGKKDKVKEILEGDDKQRSSDMSKLKLSDNVSEGEQGEKDGEEESEETHEDNTATEDKTEEGTTDAIQYTAECMKAKQSVLAYSSDNEDSCTDTLPDKKTRKTQSRKAKQEVAAVKGTKPAKKQHTDPKSQRHEGIDTASSSISTDIDSECSIGRKFTKLKEGRKKRFRLRDTEAYKEDAKLQWKCTVLVERLPDEVFQEHYERYCTDGEDGSEKKVKASCEIHSLVNLKSLKKRRANKYDTDDSDTEDSICVGKNKSRKIAKKDRNKEQEQKLIDFFSQMDDDEDNMSTGASDSEIEAVKTLRTKKSILEKESEMVMKALLASSTDDTDTDSSEESEHPEENKKKKIKHKEETDATEDVTKKEEDKEQEIKEEKADSYPSDDNLCSEDSEALKRKQKWRRDKLLTERLSDLDTSDEERRWKTKKEKEQKDNDEKKKVRRRILGSDDDSDVIVSSSDGNSSDDFISKRKKPVKKSVSGKDSTSDTDTCRKKVKRRRIKAPADDSSSSEGGQVECSQKSDTPGKGRKNIHRIMKDADVGEATRRAAREEEERRKRISEKQKLYNEIYKEVEGVRVFDKLVLDFDPETKEELVAVDPYIVSKLKPHQVKGVKFMWDACFESLKEAETTKGSGCILAHCMGLGKTLQVVALVHTLLNHKDTKVHTVLVVCPLSTVLNWVSEFNMWLKDIGNGEEVNIFELSKYKQNYERMYQLKEWQSCGGVMVMGYDMFRILTNPKAARIRKKAMETFQSTLVDPGPDLVVCDEGHMLKNEDTALSKAMNKIKTLRRIVLTGTPLQNNLKEYHCMVHFVKPNLLGTRKEFQNRFMNPISNGQFEDSTAHDVKIMKRRAHVLHKMLEGSVQRFDYSVLTPFLPPKHEYVISIRLSEVQIKAYRYYLENCAMGKSGVRSKGAQLFNDYQNLSRIWTHPRVLQMSSETAERNAERKRLMESDSEGSLRDFIDDGDATETESSNKSSSDESDVQVITGGGEKKSKPTSRCTRSRGLVEEPEVVDTEEDKKSNPFAWWKQFIEGDELENVKYSGKLVLLFSILRECEKIGDKVLVFSQSLYSLDLIEYFLACVDTATQASETKESLDNNTGSWSLGLDYFRLDGSTSAENRSIWCKSFNREDNHRARLFIISTRAGGLGINLYAANRVIVFDASWNPSHDVQSIFRVYRFGQKKPCYIYRFLAQGTMEEKIYDRQVTKLSLSCRVVDEQQIERHYNMADLQELYKFSPEEKTKHPTPILPKDRLLAELLKEHEQWIVTYHEHDSLLENKEEEELNEEERKAAWEDYENEKQGKTVPAPGVVFNAPRALNMPALRETLRKENPHATEEELDRRLSIVVTQIYEYVNSSKNAMPSSGVQYTAAHVQALRQYQIQQENYLRAQQQGQQRMPQQNVMWPVSNTYPNLDMSFRQYLQNQNQPNMGSGIYPTNLYRNVAADRPTILRMQPKLVPFNPPGTSSRTVLPNVGGNIGGPEMISHRSMILPKVPTRMTQPPFALPSSSSIVNQGQEMYDTQQSRGSTTSAPHDVIETID